jgi:hypothetical protein
MKMLRPLSIALALALSLTAYAQTMGGRFSDRQTGAFQAQMQERIQARMAEQRAAFINDLGFTTAQRQQFDDLSQRRKDLREAQQAELTAFRTRAAAALSSSNVDLTAYYQEHTRLQDTHTAQRRQVQQSFLAFYQTLNATQQGKLRAKVLEMLDQREERRARRG